MNKNVLKNFVNLQVLNDADDSYSFMILLNFNI